MEPVGEPGGGGDDGRLAAVLARVHEVDDAAAPAEVQEVYAGVRATLRVPWVSSFFRLLGSDPPLLRSLWSAIEKPLGTRYAEREADRLRTHALFFAPHPDIGAAHRARLLREGIDESQQAAIARIHQSVHYGLPKVLMAAAVGHLALQGEVVGGTHRHRPEDLRPTDRGAPASAVRPEPVPLAALAPPVRKALEELRRLQGLPYIPPYPRAFGHWPAYVERAVDDLRPLVAVPRFRAAAATLASLAAVAVRNFPERVAVTAPGRLSGEEAVVLLGFFHERLLPQLLVVAAYLRALLDGERRARSNAFSLTAR